MVRSSRPLLHLGAARCPRDTLTPRSCFPPRPPSTPPQSWKPVPRLRGTYLFPFCSHRRELDFLTFCITQPCLLRHFWFCLQHYVRLYWTGNRTDCGSPDCFNSAAHRHKTARTCRCNRVRRPLSFPPSWCHFSFGFPHGGVTPPLFIFSFHIRRPYMKTAVC